MNNFLKAFLIKRAVVEVQFTQIVKKTQILADGDVKKNKSMIDKNSVYAFCDSCADQVEFKISIMDTNFLGTFWVRCNYCQILE